MTFVPHKFFPGDIVFIRTSNEQIKYFETGLIVAVLATNSSPYFEYLVVRDCNFDSINTFKFVNIQEHLLVFQNRLVHINSDAVRVGMDVKVKEMSWLGGYLGIAAINKARANEIARHSRGVTFRVQGLYLPRRLIRTCFKEINTKHSIRYSSRYATAGTFYSLVVCLVDRSASGIFLSCFTQLTSTVTSLLINDQLWKPTSTQINKIFFNYLTGELNKPDEYKHE